MSTRLGEGRAYDSTIWLEYLSGRGRGLGFEDGYGLGMLRWQWNPNGEVLGFGQADLKRSKKAISGITLAAVHGDSPFTRFSSSGGGSLPGLDTGVYFSSVVLKTDFDLLLPAHSNRFTREFAALDCAVEISN